MSFHSAIAAALTSIREATGIEVTYHRDDDAIEGLTATPGQTKFDVTDENGAVITVESKDFLLAAADLLIDGERIEPRRQDRIREPLTGGRTAVYEVMRPDGGEDVWKFSDGGRSTIRVHTKLIATESAP